MTTKTMLQRGMTVAQLIEQLEDLPAGAVVVFTCDYGDYGHTQQALTVGNVDEYSSSDFHESAYSKSGIAMNKDDRDDDDGDDDDGDSDEAEIAVVVLS